MPVGIEQGTENTEKEERKSKKQKVKSKE